MPTLHPRHSITETPALAAVLQPLRDHLGAETPSLAELVMRGARAHLSEIDAQRRARTNTLKTFVDRLASGEQPDLVEIDTIRHSRRQRPA